MREWEREIYLYNNVSSGKCETYREKQQAGNAGKNESLTYSLASYRVEQ